MKRTYLLLLAVGFFCGHSRAQMPDYKVYAIRFASMAHPTPISMWSDKGPDKDSVNIDFSIWLIKGANGKNILVDAGFRNDIGEAKEFEVAHYIRPDSVLAKVGLKPGDITDIILSLSALGPYRRGGTFSKRAYLDPEGGLQLFCGCRVGG